MTRAPLFAKSRAVQYPNPKNESSNTNLIEKLKSYPFITYISYDTHGCLNHYSMNINLISDDDVHIKYIHIYGNQILSMAC